jgi:excisionase family DNA binding protein
MMDPALAANAPGTLLIDAAARMLGVSRRTVYYRISQGRLRTIRTRNGSQRVLRSSIEALLRAQGGGGSDGAGAGRLRTDAQAMCAPTASTYTAYSD